MRHILLVSPKRGDDIVGDDGLGRFKGAKLPSALMPPVDLATIKALTPPEFHVDIWDESVNGSITDDTKFSRNYDLIGVTAYYPHLTWALQLCGIAQRRGILAAIGGPGVSGSPDMCRGIFDVVFIGEAELTWPQFLSDWVRGEHKSEYRQVQRPDVDLSPLPDWSGFDNMSGDYVVGAVQTTRGCPFDCNFCDVIHLFGRQPRHKSVAKVLAEVAELERRGMRSVFFCDDNFIGRPKYAKDLLRGLIELNATFKKPLGFSTQLTVNVADDEEMMELIADANFQWVLIGIESPRQSSLREANKPQNVKVDLVDAVRLVQSYGVQVKGNMIVGFDHDDAAIFDETFEFLKAANILNVSVSLLKALPGTPLMARLMQEGRLIDTTTEDFSDRTRAMTNIIPLQLSRVELFKGYQSLLERVHSWEYAGHAAKGFLNGIKRMPNVPWKPAADGSRMASATKAAEFLDPASQQIVREIIQLALSKGPLMLERIIPGLFRFGAIALDLPRVVRALSRRIELESSPDFHPTIIKELPRIPANFRESIQWKAFPVTYEWLMAGMKNRHHVPAGLIEVWKDFLIRWGTTFEGFEDYHMQHLRELCDRTIEQDAAGRFGNGRVFAELENLNGSQLRRLAGEVLVSVEQDLRGSGAPAATHQTALRLPVVPA